MALVCETPLNVELSGDLVLVRLHEISDHSPNHMKLFALGGGHRLAEVLKFDLSFLELLANLVDDIRQVVPDVREQYPGQLRREGFATQKAGRHG